MGLGAIDKANFFTANAHCVAGDLNTWGWVVLCIVHGKLTTQRLPGGSMRDAMLFSVQKTTDTAADGVSRRPLMASRIAVPLVPLAGPSAERLGRGICR
jgi:hypothetical protein